MDLSDTIQPNSDQLDAIDLVSGPRTFEIERISKGTAEQPVNLHLAGFPRPWRPGKSMRRVLVSCWGADASKYVGRRLTLFCDPDVVFGGLAVGGTRISAMSDITKPKKIPLLVSRGKSAIFMVQPLVEARPAAQPATPANPLLSELNAALKANNLTAAEPALAFISDTIGREVKGTKELSREETELVIHELTNAPGGDES